VVLEMAGAVVATNCGAACDVSIAVSRLASRWNGRNCGEHWSDWGFSFSNDAISDAGTSMYHGSV